MRYEEDLQKTSRQESAGTCGDIDDGMSLEAPRFASASRARKKMEKMKDTFGAANRQAAAQRPT
jgi:hypothetical protein